MTRADNSTPNGAIPDSLVVAIRFIENGGKRVIIAHLEDALPALRGETGTHIHADVQ